MEKKRHAKRILLGFPVLVIFDWVKCALMNGLSPRYPVVDGLHFILKAWVALFFYSPIGSVITLLLSYVAGFLTFKTISFVKSSNLFKEVRLDDTMA